MGTGQSSRDGVLALEVWQDDHGRAAGEPEMMVAG